VTVICILLGYPLAYCLSQVPQRWAGILMLGVLVPFWTSLLVRTYAWLVLLQRRGIVNTALVDSGLIHQPVPLVNNLTGTIIGMVHVMVPFLVLPLYASMRSIDGTYVRAAANLGASPTKAFWQIYFPLSLPGLIAGTILTFILCLGFY
ncbi:ABC transporter permease, partial [Streptomyces sp. DSM 44915]